MSITNFDLQVTNHSKSPALLKIVSPGWLNLSPIVSEGRIPGFTQTDRQTNRKTSRLRLHPRLSCPPLKHAAALPIAAAGRPQAVASRGGAAARVQEHPLGPERAALDPRARRCSAAAATAEGARGTEDVRRRPRGADCPPVPPPWARRAPAVHTRNSAVWRG